MISQNDLDNIDSKKMYQIYDKWPQIAEEYYNIEQSSIDIDNIDNIIFVGMGGSGTLGDIFHSILSKTDMHVSIVKGYHLPKTVDKNSLVVTTSVSGNTTETLTVLDAAKNTDTNVMAFSSGGKMKAFCEKFQVPHKEISLLHSPRASFTAYLYGMLKILKPILPIRENDIMESILELKNLKNKISSHNLSKDNPSIQLAEWISGIPLIYYPWGLQAASIRFKNSLQENAKIHVIAEDIVEASHNGVVSWEKPANVNPILVQGKDDYIKTKERWDIIKEYFKQNNIDYKEIVSVEGSILSKLINLIYLFDYSSIYYSILQKTDPSPISSINFIKDRLSED